MILNKSMLPQSLRRPVAVGLVALLSLNLAGCAVTEGGQAAGGEDGRLQVVATTGYLGDAVKAIAPQAQLTVLVGPGGDPHTQPLSTADTQAIEDADVVVWTSHDMEHQMMGQLEKLGEKQVAAAEAIPENLLLPWEEDGKIEGHDPHVWNSPQAWKYAVEATAAKLAQIDSERAQEYQDNARAYLEKIAELTSYGQEHLAAVPQGGRILITGHDAFNYLGRDFDLEIHATDFVSSESQISAAQIDELAALIASKRVPVIFQDNLANPEAIKHLKEAVEAKGWKVEISNEELFADSLGESAPVDTYLGVFKHNIDTIAAALSRH